MKYKIYKIVLILLIISAIVTIGLIINKQYRSYENEIENEEIVKQFFNTEKESKIVTSIDGYNVIGIIRIPKINIEYPVLNIETSNPEETIEPMKKSIVKYWGNNVNDYGNLSIAGHNKYDGTMFRKTKNLKIGDLIELIDLEKKTIQYEIYNIFITDPNDVSILETTNSNIREVTLITCTNGNKQRLILKAKEIIK